MTAFGEGASEQSGDSFTETGNNDSLYMAANARVTLNGSSDSFGMNGGDTVSIDSGTGNIVNNDVSGDNLALFSNTSTTITGSGGGFWVEGTNINVTAFGEGASEQSGDSFTETGNNDSLYMAANARVTLNGSSDSFGMNGGDTVSIDSGTGNIVNNDVSGDNLALFSNTSTTITGSGGGFWVEGTNINVTAFGEGASEQSGNSFTETGNNDSLYMAANANVTLNGSSDSFGMNGGDGVTIASGGGDTITNDVSGDVVALDSNTAATISGSGGDFKVEGTNVAVWASNEDASAMRGDTFNLYGGGDALGLGANAYAGITGSNDTLTLHGADTEYVASGGGDVVRNDVSGDAVELAANTSATVYGSGGGTVDIYGSGVDATIAGHETVYVDSSNVTVNLEFGDTAVLASGLTGDVILATDSTIDEGSYDTVDVMGDVEDHVNGNSTDTNTGIHLGYTGFNGGSGGIVGGGGGYTSSGGGGGAGGGSDWGGYSGDDDFDQKSRALSSTGTNVELIAQFDRVMGGENLAADSAANRALEEAKVMTAAAQSGAAATPEFSEAKWQGADDANGAKGRTITWSFATGPANSSDPFSSYVDTQYKATFEDAMQAWEAVSGLIFREVPDSATSDIRIGWGDFDTSTTGVLGYTVSHQHDGSLRPGVVVRLEDPSQNSLRSGANGNSFYAETGATLYQVALHEIGHAIGLADNADPNSVMFASSSKANRTLDQTDIDGVQALYGPKPSAAARAGGSSLASSSFANQSAAGLNQMVQAMATFSPPQSSTSSSLVAQAAAQNHPLAAAHH